MFRGIFVHRSKSKTGIKTVKAAHNSPLFGSKTSFCSSPSAAGLSLLDRVDAGESRGATLSDAASSCTPSCGVAREWTWTEHTTAVSAAGGGACDTRSNQDCRCFVSEEAELCDVIVLTGEESESLGTAVEYGGGSVPWKSHLTVRKTIQHHFHMVPVRNSALKPTVSLNKIRKFWQLLSAHLMCALWWTRHIHCATQCLFRVRWRGDLYAFSFFMIAGFTITLWTSMFLWEDTQNNALHNTYSAKIT